MHPSLIARSGTARRLAAGLAGAALLLAPPVTAADSAFPKGETVRLIVGYSPGGGYDAYARMLAPHFERATGATVVIENRPGGAGLTALNQLVRGKPDGLAMMLVNGEGALIAQLTKQPAVAFDMTRVSILGRVTDEQHLLLARPGLPDSLPEVRAAGRLVKFSAMSRPDNLGDYAAVLCEALQMNCKIVTGYPGSKEAALAVLNGEVDALTLSEGSAVDYAQGGRAKILAAIGHRRSELQPGVPTVFELVQLAPERRWWLDFRLGIKSFGRTLVAPPGLPPERLRALREAWRQVLDNPAVQAEGQRTRRPIRYEAPEVIERELGELLRSLPPERLREVNEILLKKFS